MEEANSLKIKTYLSLSTAVQQQGTSFCSEKQFVINELHRARRHENDCHPNTATLKATPPVPQRLL